MHLWSMFWSSGRSHKCMREYDSFGLGGFKFFNQEQKIIDNMVGIIQFIADLAICV